MRAGRTRRVRRLIAHRSISAFGLTAVIAGSVLAGCALGGGGCDSLAGQAACTHGPTAAAGGLSMDAAVARAREVGPASTSATNFSAHIASDPFQIDRNAPPGRLVWIVYLQGGVAASPCPSEYENTTPESSMLTCLDSYGGIEVVLDYFTGALIGVIP